MSRFTMKDFKEWNRPTAQSPQEGEGQPKKPVDHLIWWPVFLGFVGGFIATSQAKAEGVITRKYWNIAAIVTAIGMVIWIPLVFLIIHLATVDPTSDLSSGSSDSSTSAPVTPMVPDYAIPAGIQAAMDKGSNELLNTINSNICDTVKDDKSAEEMAQTTFSNFNLDYPENNLFPGAETATLPQLKAYFITKCGVS